MTTRLDQLHKPEIRGREGRVRRERKERERIIRNCLKENMKNSEIREELRQNGLICSNVEVKRWADYYKMRMKEDEDWDAFCRRTG